MMTRDEPAHSKERGACTLPLQRLETPETTEWTLNTMIE